jgi:hypothetical protein
MLDEEGWYSLEELHFRLYTIAKAASSQAHSVCMNNAPKSIEQGGAKYHDLECCMI